LINEFKLISYPPVFRKQNSFKMLVPCVFYSVQSGQIRVEEKDQNKKTTTVQSAWVNED